jgi:hypothetical protein
MSARDDEIIARVRRVYEASNQLHLDHEKSEALEAAGLEE